MSAKEIAATGIPMADVGRVLGLIRCSKYKRRQGAIGPKLTTRAFGPRLALSFDFWLERIGVFGRAKNCVAGPSLNNSQH